MSGITSQDDERSFYHELDKESLKKSCCTCQSMAIFFVILGLIVGGMTYYLFRQIKTIDWSIRKVDVGGTVFNLKDKFNPDSNSPTFSITVTSQELTAMAKNGLKATGFSINEPQIIITNEDIEVDGKLTKPLSTQIKIFADPIVEQGRLHFKVKSTKAGKLALPGFINGQIESELNKMLDEKFADLYQNYEVTQTYLETDRLNIVGALK